MSITDELREYATNDKLHYLSDYIAIADRIDAEHQKAMDELMAIGGSMWQRGYGECHDELMEGHPVIVADLEKCGWVRLPVDADGEYIHVGDVMVYTDGNTCPLPVVALVPPAVFLTDDGPRYADMCRHQPDTWERIIEDARTCTGSAGNYTSVPSMRWTNEVDALVARCKALAGDAE